jgi:O-antigen ligase
MNKMIYRIRFPRFFPARDKVGIQKIIRGGLWFLIIFSPLPAASVGYWAILTIQLIVISLMVLYLLMKKKPEINPQLSALAARLRLPLLIFFVFACVQFFPLPKLLLQVLSPGTVHFYQGFSFEPVRLSLLSISLAPFQSFRETMEILTYVLAGFLAIKTVTTKKQLRSMLYLIVGMGVFQSFYGMFQLSRSDPRILFYKKTVNLDMLTGTFINQNHLAGYLAMIFPLAVGLIVAGINPYRMSQKQWRERFIHLTNKRGVSHIILTTAVIVMCSGIFLSRSRMGLFLIFFSFILFAQFSILYFGGLKQAQTLLKKYVRIVLVVATAAILFFGVDATLDRFALENLAQEGRPQYWANMTRMIGDFPLLGTGLGTFAYAYPSYEKGQIHAFLVHAHNDYLEYLSELGVPGMALLMYIIIFMALWIFRVWRKRRNPENKGLGMGGMVSLLLIGTHSFTDFNLHIPSNMLLFTLVFCLTAVAVHLDWKGSLAKSEKKAKNKALDKHPESYGNRPNP